MMVYSIRIGSSYGYGDCPRPRRLEISGKLSRKGDGAPSTQQKRFSRIRSTYICSDPYVVMIVVVARLFHLTITTLKVDK